MMPTPSAAAARACPTCSHSQPCLHLPSTLTWYGIMRSVSAMSTCSCQVGCELYCVQEFSKAGRGISVQDLCQGHALSFAGATRGRKMGGSGQQTSCTPSETAVAIQRYRACAQGTVTPGSTSSSAKPGRPPSSAAGLSRVSCRHIFGRGAGHP